MPLVVHYWADLQSGHGLRCYGNITRMRNVSEYMLVLALCLVMAPYAADAYIIFLSRFFLSSFFFSWPNLSSRRLDVYHTSTHGQYISN